MRTFASSAPNGSSSSRIRGSIASAGERHPLALAARELARVAEREPVELDQAQQLHDPGVDLGLAGACPARPDPEPEGHVLEHAHVPEERVVLEDEAHLALARIAQDHVLAGEPNLAAIGDFEPGQDPEQGRLARPGRTEERAELALHDVEADAMEGGVGSEGLGQIADLDAHDDLLG